MIISPINIYGVLFGIFFLLFGIGTGFIISFTFIGLIGGLIALLFFNRKAIMFPNPKVAIFVGYIGFVVIFIVLPFLLSSAFSYRSSGFSSFNLLTFLLVFFSIPFIHCVITIGFYIFLEKRNAFNSNYFAFITAYFLASLVLAPTTMFFSFLTYFGGFSAASSMLPI